MDRQHASTLLVFSSESSDDEDLPLDHMPVKRMAIIDACNVMHFCAGYALNAPVLSYGEKKPDALGLLLLVRQLLAEGFDLQMYVPVSYMGLHRVENRYVLEHLQRLGYLTVIDDGSHDDLIILEEAKMAGGFVISNDKFRDHSERLRLLDGCDAEMMLDVIQNRTVTYTFQKIGASELPEEFMSSRHRDRFFFGFKIILQPKEERAMLAEDNANDPTFSTVFSHRMIRSELKCQKTLELLGVMADYAQLKICDAKRLRPPNIHYYDVLEDGLPEEFCTFLDAYNCYKTNNDFDF